MLNKLVFKNSFLWAKITFSGGLFWGNTPEKKIDYSYGNEEIYIRIFWVSLGLVVISCAQYVGRIRGARQAHKIISGSISSELSPFCRVLLRLSWHLCSAAVGKLWETVYTLAQTNGSQYVIDGRFFRVEEFSDCCFRGTNLARNRVLTFCGCSKMFLPSFVS